MTRLRSEQGRLLEPSFVPFSFPSYQQHRFFTATIQTQTNMSESKGSTLSGLHRLGFRRLTNLICPLEFIVVFKDGVTQDEINGYVDQLKSSGEYTLIHLLCPVV